MIILDTNQLHRNRTLDTPTLTILTAVARVTGNELALPAIVVEEFVARYEHDLDDAREATTKAVSSYRRLNLNWNQPDPLFPATTSVGMDVGSKLRQIFRVLVVGGDTAREALRREILRKRPASVGWKTKGSGARDAAIWLTALMQLSEGDVYFVSDDKDAFGDQQLHAELEDEARRGGTGQLIFCPNVDDLLQRLATHHELPQQEAEAIANDPKVHEVVLESLDARELFGEMIGHIKQLSDVAYFSAHEPPVLSPEHIFQTTAYLVEDELWASNRITWTCQRKIVANRSLAQDNEEWMFEFRFKTTVLVRLGESREVVVAQTTAITPLEILRAFPTRRWLGDQ